MNIFSNRTFFKLFKSIEEELNKVDLGFLLKEKGEVKDLKLEINSMVVEFAKKYWDIELKSDSDLFADIITDSTKAQIGKLTVPEVTSGKFKIIEDEDGGLTVKNNDLTVMTFERSKIKVFYEMFVENLVSGRVTASEFLAKDLIKSDSEESVVISDLVLENNLPDELMSKDEFALRCEILNKKMDDFEKAHYQVMETIDADRTPTVTIDRSELEADESRDGFISSSGWIAQREGEGEYFFSEVIDITSNYLTDSSVYSTVTSGNLKLFFREDQVCIDDGTFLYLIFFKEFLSTYIEVGINNNHGMITIRDDMTVYKYTKTLELLREVTEDFPYGDIRLVNAVNNYIESSIEIELEVVNGFSEKHSRNNTYVLNKGVSLDLQDVLLQDDFILTDVSKVEFDNKYGDNYSSGIGFGFFTEHEYSRQRKESFIDLSRGLVDKESGVRVAISKVSLNIYIPSEKENEEKKVLIKLNDKKYEFDNDLDLGVELEVRNNKVISLEFTDVNNVFGGYSDENSWEESVRTFLKLAGILDNNNKLSNLFFDNFQLNKLHLDKFVEMSMIVVTEAQSYRNKVRFSMVETEQVTSNILINEKKTASYNFLPDIKEENFISEDIFFSCDSLEEIIANSLIKSLTWEIYDLATENPVTKIAKSSQEPTNFTFSREGTGEFVSEAGLEEKMFPETLGISTKLVEESIGEEILVRVVGRANSGEILFSDEKYFNVEFDGEDITYKVNSLVQILDTENSFMADMDKISKESSSHDITLGVESSDFRIFENFNLNFKYDSSNMFEIDGVKKNIEKADITLELKQKNTIEIRENAGETTGSREIYFRWNTTDIYNEVHVIGDLVSSWEMKEECKMVQQAGYYELHLVIPYGTNTVGKEFILMIDGKTFFSPPLGEMIVECFGTPVALEENSDSERGLCWNLTPDFGEDYVNAVKFLGLEKQLYNLTVLESSFKYSLNSNPDGEFGVILKRKSKFSDSWKETFTRIFYNTKSSELVKVIDMKKYCQEFSYETAELSPAFHFISRIGIGNEMVQKKLTQTYIRFAPKIQDERIKILMFKIEVDINKYMDMTDECEVRFNSNSGYYYVSDENGVEVKTTFDENPSYIFLVYSDSGITNELEIKMHAVENLQETLGTIQIEDYSFEKRFGNFTVSKFTGTTEKDKVNFFLEVIKGNNIAIDGEINGGLYLSDKKLVENFSFEGIKGSDEAAFEKINLSDSSIYRLSMNRETYKTSEREFLDLRCYQTKGNNYTFDLEKITYRFPDPEEIEVTSVNYNRILSEMDGVVSVRSSDVDDYMYSYILMRFFRNGIEVESDRFYDLYIRKYKSEKKISISNEGIFSYYGEQNLNKYLPATIECVEKVGEEYIQKPRYDIGTYPEFYTQISSRVVCDSETGFGFENLSKFSRNGDLSVKFRMKPFNLSTVAGLGAVASVRDLQLVDGEPEILVNHFSFSEVFAGLGTVYETEIDTFEMESTIELKCGELELELECQNPMLILPKIDFISSFSWENQVELALLQTYEFDELVVKFLVDEDLTQTPTINGDRVLITGLDSAEEYSIRLEYMIGEKLKLVSGEKEIKTGISNIYFEDFLQKGYDYIKFTASGDNNYFDGILWYQVLKGSEIYGENPVSEGIFSYFGEPIIADLGDAEQDEKFYVRVTGYKNGVVSSNVEVDDDGKLDFQNAPYFYSKLRGMSKVTDCQEFGGEIYIFTQFPNHPESVQYEVEITDEDTGEITTLIAEES